MNLSKFLARIEAADNGCWLWMGRLAPNGYGRISTSKTKREAAHRVSWRLHSIPTPPPGYDLCHTCDNRRCVNPEHLFMGSRLDNMRDASAKGRLVQKLTHKQIAEIRSDRYAGMLGREVARIFGVDTSRIYQLRKSARGAR